MARDGVVFARESLRSHTSHRFSLLLMLHIRLRRGVAPLVMVDVSRTSSEGVKMFRSTGAAKLSFDNHPYHRKRSVIVLLYISMAGVACSTQQKLT